MTRWRERISSICGWAAAFFLTAMMLLTVADVALRAFFNYPIRGVFEMIELLLAATFFLALPSVFLRDENILVNSIDDFAPRWVPLLKRVANLIAVAVLVVMAWQGLIAARDSFEFNDVTADLGIPRLYHWIAVLAGLTGAAVAALYMALRGEGRPEDRL